MTKEEAQILSTMTYWERVRKYFPLLQEGKINNEQYDYVIQLGRQTHSQRPEVRPQSVDSGEVTPEEFIRGLAVSVATEGLDTTNPCSGDAESPRRYLQDHGREHDARGVSDGAVGDSGTINHPPQTVDHRDRQQVSQGDREAPKAESTNHPCTKDGLSQKGRLLRLLEDGEWHGSPEIIKEVYGDKLTGARYGARIQDLKDDGYEIESEKVEGALWKYRLLDSQHGKVLLGTRPVGKTASYESRRKEVDVKEGQKRFEEIATNISSG